MVDIIFSAVNAIHNDRANQSTIRYTYPLPLCEFLRTPLAFAYRGSTRKLYPKLCSRCRASLPAGREQTIVPSKCARRNDNENVSPRPGWEETDRTQRPRLVDFEFVYKAEIRGRCIIPVDTFEIIASHGIVQN